MIDTKELNSEELEKVGGGSDNLNKSQYGITFEKGKWVQLPQDSTYAYKLVELTDSNLVVDAWNKRTVRERLNPEVIIECTRNHTLPKVMLYNLIEINKPDWVNE